MNEKAIVPLDNSSNTNSFATLSNINDFPTGKLHIKN